MLNKRIFAVVAVSVVFTLSSFAQTPEQQATPTPTPSTCKGSGCSGVSRAELFIKTFASSGNSKGLKIAQLEQEEQVRLAFYGIDATRVEVEKGRLTEKEGKFIIDGHVQVIRDYVHDQGNEAIFKAETGQVSDIPAISKSLGRILSVARQDQLLGHEESAQRAQEQIVKIFTTFSQKFAETCEQQTFPVEVAIALERQNQLLGTEISLTHCMNRKFSADLESQGVHYHFESCSNLSYMLVWDMKISGRVVGVGKGTGHTWKANVNYRGFKDDPWGDVEFITHDIEKEKEESVAISNDIGPNAKPNGWNSAPIPKEYPFTGKRMFLTMRITTIFLIGDRGYNGDTPNHHKWAEAEIKREDKPCKHVTLEDS